MFPFPVWWKIKVLFFPNRFTQIFLRFIFQNWYFLTYDMSIFFTTHLYQCEKGWCISASQSETCLQAGCSDTVCWGLVALIPFQLSKSENEREEVRMGVGRGALIGNWGVLLIHLSVWRKTWKQRELSLFVTHTVHGSNFYKSPAPSPARNKYEKIQASLNT